MSVSAAASPAESIVAGLTYSRVLKVVWLSVGLGLALQVLTALALLMLSGTAPGAAAMLRDSVQKVSWSTIVCTALAVGSATARARVAWTGVLGLLAAPLAFILARLLQKGVGQVLGAHPDAIASGVFVALLAIKSVEYGLLGVALHFLNVRWRAGLVPHLAAGAVAGLVFGGLALLVILLGSQPSPNATRLTIFALNELVFPIGCSLTLYASGSLARRLASAA